VAFDIHYPVSEFVKLRMRVVVYINSTLLCDICSMRDLK